MAGATGATYWVGADGNYYYGSGVAGAPIQNLGFAGSTNPNIDIINNATQIKDPSAPNSTVGVGADGANPTALTGSSTPPASTKPLNTAAIANTQGAIDQIPGLLNSALASEGQNFNNTTGAYDAGQKQQQGQYDQSTETNQHNYDSNFMDAIRAGIKGFSGLMQLLRGSGAAGGSTDNQVRNIVGDTTSGDIRTAADTRGQNQDQLDSALGSYLTELQAKRQAAIDTHANNTRAISRDSSTQLQDLYTKMAGFYGDAGDTNSANDWMSKAGALTPDIATNSKLQTSAYDNTPIVVHAPNLTAFAPPSQPNSINVPSNGQVGAGIFTVNRPVKKDDTSTPAPNLVGA